MDLCMSSWLLEFGWNVFSLACWDGERDRGWMGHSHRWESPCALPASFPLILPPFPGAMELGKHFGEGRVIGDQSNRMVPVPQCMPQAALLGQCQPCWQLCQRLLIPERMSQFP